MQPALTTTQKQKSPSSSSKKSRIKFIMPSTVRLPLRSFTIVLSDVEQDYLDSIKFLEQKADKK